MTRSAIRLAASQRHRELAKSAKLTAVQCHERLDKCHSGHRAKPSRSVRILHHQRFILSPVGDDFQVLRWRRHDDRLSDSEEKTTRWIEFAWAADLHATSF